MVLDHLGCPRLGRSAEEDAAVLSHWRAGMAALAALPNVSVKLSGLAYIRNDWMSDAAAHAQVAGLVKEVLALFGPARIMAASNFPVDRFVIKPTPNLEQLYTAMHKLLKDEAHLTDADIKAIFHDNPVKFYKVDKL